MPPPGRAPYACHRLVKCARGAGVELYARADIYDTDIHIRVFYEMKIALANSEHQVQAAQRYVPRGQGALAGGLEDSAGL